MEYRRYCGIDFLSDGNNFVFIEFNNRMQGSSALVDHILQYNHHVSIYELAINAVKDTLSDLNAVAANNISYANYST